MTRIIQASLEVRVHQIYEYFGIALANRCVTVTIVNRVDALETHLKNNTTHLCFCSGLCRNKVLHRHVRIVFLPI